MSAPQCPRPCWVQTVIIIAGLLILAIYALRAPLIPDPDDCAARGRAADCWRDAPARP